MSFGKLFGAENVCKVFTDGHRFELRRFYADVAFIIVIIIFKWKQFQHDVLTEFLILE
jgi:hypothetical protein